MTPTTLIASPKLQRPQIPDDLIASAPGASAQPSGTPRLLLVDDDPIILDALAGFLRSATSGAPQDGTGVLSGYQVDTASDGTEALHLLATTRYALVITDINMPRTNGLELLRAIRQNHADTVVIVCTGYGTIENAVETIKLGAFDYLTKPVVDDELRVAIQKALKHHHLVSENHHLRQQLDLRYSLDNVVGHDYKMLKIFDLVEAVADSKTTVLMTGESGTGKSLVARAIHHRSPRANKPFIEVSCGAIPESLLESELFGHVKGSFTGATADKHGRFLAADGGTIFLDEINSASPGFQVKLLKVLQEKKFEPVGSNKTLTVDVRVVLASNQDLSQLVQQGTFRQDLYYRINVVNILLPSLRERLGDIPLLAESFLQRLAKDTGRRVTAFSPEAVDLLRRYPWPGNVRELENAIERAVVLSKRPILDAEDFPQQILEYAANSTAHSPGSSVQTTTSSTAASSGGLEYTATSLAKALEEPEKQILVAALNANGWNRQVTAQQLDINRTTLYKKMKHYGLLDDPTELAG